MERNLSQRTRVSRRVYMNDTEQWQKPDRPTFRCEVHVYPGESGGFIVVSANLGGVRAVGATEAEALANVKQALIAAIPLNMREDGRVNWLNPPAEVGPGGTIKVVRSTL